MTSGIAVEFEEDQLSIRGDGVGASVITSRHSDGVSVIEIYGRKDDSIPRVGNTWSETDPEFL